MQKVTVWWHWWQTVFNRLTLPYLLKSVFRSVALVVEERPLTHRFLLLLAAAPAPAPTHVHHKINEHIATENKTTKTKKPFDFLTLFILRLGLAIFFLRAREEGEKKPSTYNGEDVGEDIHDLLAHMFVFLLYSISHCLQRSTQHVP